MFSRLAPARLSSKTAARALQRRPLEHALTSRLARKIQAIKKKKRQEKNRNAVPALTANLHPFAVLLSAGVKKLLNLT